MKMKMSSARVAMAHDWKIAEAAWLHSAAKNGKRFGSEGSSLAFFFSHISVVFRPRVAHALHFATAFDSRGPSRELWT